MSNEYKYTYCGTLEMYYEQGVGGMPILHDNRGCTIVKDTFSHRGLEIDSLRKDIRYAYFFEKEKVYITVYGHDKGEILFDGVLNPDSKSSRQERVWLPKEIDKNAWYRYLHEENHAVLKCNKPALFEANIKGLK
jgi:hypothetical protein